MTADALADSKPASKTEYLPQYYVVLPFLVLFLFMLALNWRVAYYPKNDDAYFLRLVNEKGFGEYITWRYATWTGRLFSEILVDLFFRSPLIYWKVLNSGMIVLLAFSWSVLLSGWGFWRRLDRTTWLTSWFLCAALGWIKHTVLVLAVFWVTGTLYYLWPLVLTMIALIPFVEKAIHAERNADSLPGWFYPLSGLAGICACLGIEQAAVLLVGSGALCIIYLAYQKRRVDIWLVGLMIGFILASVFSATAPGNPLRYQYSLSFIPGFETYSFQKRAYLSYAWILKSVFVQNRMCTLLLIGMILGMSAKLTTAPVRWLRGLLIGFAFLLIAGAASWFDFYQPAAAKLTKILFTFQAPEEMLKDLARYGLFSSDFLITQAPLLIWGIGLIVILLLMVQLHEQSGLYTGLMQALIFGIGLGTLFIVSLSPTIYESGQRTVFAFNLTQIFLLAVLFKALSQSIPPPVMALLFAFPVMNFILIGQYLLLLK